MRTFLSIVVICITVYAIFLEKKPKKTRYEEEKNNLIEFIWEDEHWNWIYKFK